MIDQMDDVTPKSDAGGPPGETDRQKETKYGFFPAVTSHWRLVFTLFLLFLIAIMFQWKTISVDSITEKMQAERKQRATQVKRIVLDKNIDLVRLSAIPLSWAVRSEMINKNFENIDRYFKRLIKESRFKSIALSNMNGTIIVATDKKFEGTKAARIYSPAVLGHDETTVKVLTNGDILAVAPVLDVSDKLGDLILVYAPEKENLGKAKHL